MRFLAVIQARSGSTRLPGKVLKDIAGRSQLEWVVRRVSRCGRVDKVVVATTDRPDDYPVLSQCEEIGVECFAGSENDVLDRYYQVARRYEPEYVVRVTGDCPCFDPGLLDEAICELRPDADYLGMVSETFPDGLDLEIVRYSALVEAWEEAGLASEREHATQFIVKRPERYRIQDFASRIGDHGGERWTVDEPEDLELVREVFHHFIGQGDEGFGYADILAFLDSKPELRSINRGFARNEGLAKSVAHDHVVKAHGGSHGTEGD